MSQVPYRPISCNFYDELVLLAMRSTDCTIRLLDAEGRPFQIQGIIKDLETRSGEEFMLLQDGRRFRLDQIQQVNDLSPNNYC